MQNKLSLKEQCVQNVLKKENVFIADVISKIYPFQKNPHVRKESGAKFWMRKNGMNTKVNICQELILV